MRINIEYAEIIYKFSVSNRTIDIIPKRPITNIKIDTVKNLTTNQTLFDTFQSSTQTTPKPNNGVFTVNIPESISLNGMSDDDDLEIYAIIEDNEMLSINGVSNRGDDFSFTVSQQRRVAQFTTLFDGKMLSQNNGITFDNKGTGAGLFSGNTYSMSVGANEWFVKQAKRFSPYFSGKPQLIECTFDRFHLQENVIKRFGYFSSNAVIPFDSEYDGFYVENNGSTYKLVVKRNGSTVLEKDWTQWVGYDRIKDYNFQNFTVMAFDFLWLGGAVLRLWIKTDSGFVLLDSFHYAGTYENVFILSPNQPIRYEIRSVGGIGQFRYICSQVSTEGSLSEEGFNGSVNTGVDAVPTNSVGTKYPLLSVRKRATHRNIASKITNLNIFVGSSDIVLYTLELNPTISGAGLSYVAKQGTSIESGIGDGILTVTESGRVLVSGYLTQDAVIPTNLFEKDYLSYLGIDLDNNSEPLAICITPLSVNANVYGAIMFKDSTN